MPEVYTIPLSKIIHELQLETAFLPKSADDILIQSRDVVRPGMELNGYHEYFDPNRIAVLGRAEMYMLESLKPERRAMALDSYLSLKPPAVIVSRGIDPGKDFMEIAETYHVPVLRTTESTSNVVASLVAYLNVELAPRITRHGVLVEVYGEGILLVGDSGVGKSETAIELIKRGHRLIADDAVEIRRVSSKSLVGQSPENIRHFIELRGIGIINARRIFGMGAVKLQEKIDMCINLEIWDATKVYDRMGMDIGPKTRELYAEAIKGAKTVFWNGPMGVFEMDQFAVGTKAVAEAVAEVKSNGGTSIIGGGDSVAAINKFDLADKMSWISTGGGASMELVEGKALPGVEALLDA